MPVSIVLFLFRPVVFEGNLSRVVPLFARVAPGCAGIRIQRKERRSVRGWTILLRLRKKHRDTANDYTHSDEDASLNNNSAVFLYFSPFFFPTSDPCRSTLFPSSRMWISFNETEDREECDSYTIFAFESLWISPVFNRILILNKLHIFFSKIVTIHNIFSILSVWYVHLFLLSFRSRCT